MKSKSLKTPLRYPGGKSRACTKIESYFPDLSEYKEYREPFLGGGSVALYVTKKFPNLKISVTDLYEPLVNFWQVLQRGKICQYLACLRRRQLEEFLGSLIHFPKRIILFFYQS